MAEHPNIRLIQEMMQEFNRGNPGAVMATFADDAVLHVPGQSPIAGTYRGKAEIGQFFGKMGQLSEGPPRVDVQHILTSGAEIAVVIWRAYGRRKGTDYEGTAGYLFRIREGKIVEAHNLQEDQEKIDHFWSA